MATPLELLLAVRATTERVASPAEALALSAALQERDRVIWATALYAGLRLGEMKALQVEEIDLERGMMSVERSWDAIEGAIETKSRSGRRRIPIVDELRSHETLERAGAPRAAAISPVGTLCARKAALCVTGDRVARL